MVAFSKRDALIDVGEPLGYTHSQEFWEDVTRSLGTCAFLKFLQLSSTNGKMIPLANIQHCATLQRLSLSILQV